MTNLLRLSTFVLVKVYFCIRLSTFDLVKVYFCHKSDKNLDVLLQCRKTRLLKIGIWTVPENYFPLNFQRVASKRQGGRNMPFRWPASTKEDPTFLAQKGVKFGEIPGKIWDNKGLWIYPLELDWNCWSGLEHFSCTIFFKEIFYWLFIITLLKKLRLWIKKYKVEVNIFTFSFMLTPFLSFGKEMLRDVFYD